MREISNPGSALGEAIGVVIEDALNEMLEPIAKTNDCIYVTVGPKNIETKLDTKLLLTDSNFEISFDTICRVLEKFGIDFRWDEKDRKKAYDAWNTFASLTQEQRSSIGKMLIAWIEKDLTKIISRVLDNTSPRSIKHVEIQVTTNLGETKVFIFSDTEQALKFLQEIDERKILSTENSPSLFENAGFEVRPEEESDREETEEE